MDSGGSDSDDFFDAYQDLNSPKYTGRPSLVAENEDETLSPEKASVESNIPQVGEGGLMLTHLLENKQDSESIVTDNVSPQPSSLTFNYDDVEISEETDNLKIATNKEFQESLSITSAHSENHEEEHQIKSSSNKSTSVISQSLENTVKIPESLPENKDKSGGEKMSEKAIPAAELCDIIINSVKKMNSGTLQGNESRSSSKPDLVASITERPSNLPGVVPVDISYSDPSKPEVIKIKESDTPMKISQPSKKVPPPRPKAPPKRPPQPKFTKLKDEGLLTPNSTVEKITKVFVDVLNNDEVNNKEKKLPLETPEMKSNKKGIPPKSSSTLPNLQRESLEKKKPGSFVRRSSSSTMGSQSLNSSTLSQFDDERTWSEMTKNTVLRIDSSPGLEILSTVIVRNLDTGQSMPLSAAAEQVAQCLNPLALQIISRTKEFNPTVNQEDSVSTTTSMSNRKSHLSEESLKMPSEEDTFSVASDDITIGMGVDSSVSKQFHEGSRKLRIKSKRFKKIIGKGARKVKEVTSTQVERAVQKVKHAKVEGSNAESLNVSSDEEMSDSLQSTAVKFKASSSHKGPHQFTNLKLVQDIAVHVGAVWSMKFSHCGRLLATAGQNNIIWVWVLKEYFNFFNDMRTKYDNKERGAVFATPPRSEMEPLSSISQDDMKNQGDLEGEDEDAPFRSLPFSSYVGHTADVLDLAWSKNYFTLSSSMDKTVRLWHVSQKECLCCFQHIDFVTAISFHPRDDRYFLSGSLDSKLRLWNIPEKKVALWNEVSPDSSGSNASSNGGALITTVNFCENGKFAVCGTYDGRCLFYDTEHLKYHTQIHVRSSRGRNTKGHKITGIEPLQGEHKILVTSNDSRVRLYDLRDLSLTCKYKGLTNTSSQIKASFSHDNKYIICGSEDKSVYIWRTNLPQDVAKISSFRRDLNDCWESVRAHDAVVTCSIFAPFPHLIVKNPTSDSKVSLVSKKSSNVESCVVISADFNGVIKIFINS